MVFRWFLWVRQVVCVCVCEREREREREREIWSWLLCFACFLCLCLSEFHSCCKYFDFYYYEWGENLSCSDTCIHSLTWEWMYEYDTCNTTRKWKRREINLKLVNLCRLLSLSLHSFEYLHWNRLMQSAYLCDYVLYQWDRV